MKRPRLVPSSICTSVRPTSHSIGQSSSRLAHTSSAMPNRGIHRCSPAPVCDGSSSDAACCLWRHPQVSLPLQSPQSHIGHRDRLLRCWRATVRLVPTTRTSVAMSLTVDQLITLRQGTTQGTRGHHRSLRLSLLFASVQPHQPLSIASVSDGAHRSPCFPIPALSSHGRAGRPCPLADDERPRQWPRTRSWRVPRPRCVTTQPAHPLVCRRRR